MALDPDIRQTAVSNFIASLADIAWISCAGDPDDAAIVADDLVDAWDGWNAEMVAVWRPQTHALERVAVDAMGEDGVDAVFAEVSLQMDGPLREAMERYFDTRSKDEANADRGLWPEWLDSVKRDLSWAAIEAVLGRPGFFTELLRHYRAGRWPCAYENGDRKMRVVVL